MVPGSQVLYKAVTERRVLHDGHAALAQHVSNASQRQTRRGFRFDKPGETVKIDALVALVMAYDRSQHIEPPTQFHGWL